MLGHGTSMVVRKKQPKRGKPSAPGEITHQFTVVLEEIRAQNKAFGEGQQLLREQMQAGFEEMHRRFAQVDARFAQVDARFAQVDGRFAQVEGRLERVEHEIGLLKDATLEHGRELKRHGQQLEALRTAVEKKVDRDEVEAMIERAVGPTRAH